MLFFFSLPFSSRSPATRPATCQDRPDIRSESPGLPPPLPPLPPPGRRRRLSCPIPDGWGVRLACLPACRLRVSSAGRELISRSPLPRTPPPSLRPMPSSSSDRLAVCSIARYLAAYSWAWSLPPLLCRRHIPDPTDLPYLTLPASPPLAITLPISQSPARLLTLHISSAPLAAGLARFPSHAPRPMPSLNSLHRTGPSTHHHQYRHPSSREHCVGPP